MTTVLGIDVGMYGAFAFYDGDELLIYDAPIVERNKTKRIDCLRLNDIIRLNKPAHAYVEQVNAFGMGASGAYNFGWSCGVVEAVLCAHQVPYTYVTPQVWKKAMSCPKDKDASRMRASQLLPSHAHNWERKKDDGRAEAALLALLAYEKYK